MMEVSVQRAHGMDVQLNKCREHEDFFSFARIHNYGPKLDDYGFLSCAYAESCFSSHSI